MNALLPVARGGGERHLQDLPPRDGEDPIGEPLCFAAAEEQTADVVLRILLPEGTETMSVPVPGTSGCPAPDGPQPIAALYNGVDLESKCGAREHCF